MQYLFGKMSPKSIIGWTLKKYTQLDELSVECGSSCADDCAACCRDYFYITEGEYLAILHYLMSVIPNVPLSIIESKAAAQMNEVRVNLSVEYTRLSEDHNAVKEPVNDMLQYYAHPYDVYGDIRLGVACPFLTKKGRCLIYSVRPLACRSFGTVNSYDSPFCFKVRYGNDNQLNETFLSLSCSIFDSLLIDYNQKFRRPYPLSYWITEKTTSFSDIAQLVKIVRTAVNESYETFSLFD